MRVQEKFKENENENENRTSIKWHCGKVKKKATMDIARGRRYRYRNTFMAIEHGGKSNIMQRYVLVK